MKYLELSHDVKLKALNRYRDEITHTIKMVAQMNNQVIGKINDEHIAKFMIDFEFEFSERGHGRPCNNEYL